MIMWKWAQLFLWIGVAYTKLEKTQLDLTCPGKENLYRQAKTHVWLETPDCGAKLSFTDIKDQFTSPLIQTVVCTNERAKTDPRALKTRSFLFNKLP